MPDLKQRSFKNPERRRYLRWVGILAGVGIVGAIALKFAWSNQFPYGHSHSCSKVLGSTLRHYAEDQAGWLPNGGATPEQSFSLIWTNGDPYSVRDILRGKNLAQADIDAALARDGFLSPQSCGWHYVEGLREDDDPKLAVVWDRTTGLDHNGRRRSGLIHEVIMLDGSMHLIFEGKWKEFVETQRKLLSETMARRPTNSPPIRWSDEEVLGPNRQKPAR